VVTTKEHIFKFQYAMVEHAIEDDHEDVVMNPLVLSLEEDARIWFINIDDNSIQNWENFREAFLEQCEVKNDDTFCYHENLHKRICSTTAGKSTLVTIGRPLRSDWYYFSFRGGVLNGCMLPPNYQIYSYSKMINTQKDSLSGCP